MKAITQFKKIYFLIISFLLISCSFNEFYKDRESDKKDGEKVSQKFYWELRHGANQDDIYKLFGEKFFTVTDKEKLVELLNITNKIGPIQEYNLVKWETMVIKGSNARSQYFFVYEVKRGVEKTEESFTLEKDKDGNIKIVGYRVNQNLLSK
ncbi:hypothetical protein ATE47_12095 [Chryseobacterium sp. IHB B 17019]|uniref:hypothetical protein n=1 Tax=Chryseobacterium sp. IHB B 17019 TaxID=1721091 RepID=UPI0007229729|nr:hypothetical protein [Chryseobacterium sp. IHB B 17019]ALR31216.1 hypothetical protein ATE47_12095 [Chryseobacterium sp. IHB B 17019]